jgi:hypothetical protein
LGQSIAMIPSTLATVTREVLSGDLLGALTTIETAIVGSVVAVGEPTLAAIIERRQRFLAVRSALQVAVPQAFFSVVGGVGPGADEVLRAFITPVSQDPLVSVDAPTEAAEVDGADPAAGTTVTTAKTESGRDFKKVASPKDDPAPKGGTSAAADQPDQSTPSSPKYETKKKKHDESPKHETAKADSESESEGAKQK